MSVVDTWTIFLGIAGLLVNGAGLGFISFQVSLPRRQADRAQRAEEAELVRRGQESTANTS